MIARGQMTLVVIGWANRDENIFHNPYELDITREPNKHMSFGHGIYFLPGSAACSLEAEVAISTLLRRIPELRLSVPSDALRWRRGMILRGLDSLPISFAASKQS
jgi:cytochrome P450